MTFKRTDFVSQINLNSCLLEAITNRDRYDNFLSRIYRMWEETILSIDFGRLNDKKLKKLDEFHDEWDKLVYSIKEIDLAIRTEINLILIFVSSETNKNTAKADLTQLLTYETDYTNSYEINSSFSSPGQTAQRRQISAKFQSSIFRLLRLCIVLNDKVIAIMYFLQKARNEFCTTETNASMMEETIRANNETDDPFVKQYLEIMQQNFSSLAKKIDKRNTIEGCKPISQKRCAELIVDELDAEFPRISKQSIKRMLSDWDTGRRKPVRDYFIFKNSGDEVLFSNWAKVFFASYYRLERRGKYQRKKTTHSQHALDQHAFNQHKRNT